MLIDGALNRALNNSALRQRLISLKDRTNEMFVPHGIAANRRHLSPEGDRELRAIIRDARDADDAGVEFEMTFRLTGFRNTVVPWLAQSLDLNGCRILEVGCGSGAGTVALAEQGAIVTGIDIDDLCIRIGRERLSAYGLHADLRAVDGSGLPAGQYDLIIFFASLEHMTMEERLTNLSDAWSLLPRGGRLCVVETPNRLWWYDDHTSAMPFFEWLPDSLAIRYADRSPRLREYFSGKPVDDANLLQLARSGRGLSFHEFDVVGIPTDRVESCMVEFLRRNPLYAAKYHLSSDRRFSRMIRRMAPHVARPYFYHRLDLLIRKE